ncbi:MAG: GNAT family N-acetyltransferase [Armatimonadetes bacterium]|nr:GNAT family N-acetyltransferase [Armatimonadota bacterium]
MKVSEASTSPMVIRRAAPEDLMAAARTYLAAFPDTLQQLRAPGMRPEAVCDLLRICLEAEPESLLIGVRGEDVAGYVIAPCHPTRIIRTALLRGHLPRLVWGSLSGRYGLGIGTGLQVLLDKLHFLSSTRVKGATCEARILSIAVHPRFQGLGIGRRLLEAGLGHLRACGVCCVRLEVRPDNVPARTLYESVGFRTVGVVRDTRGPWEVMVLEWGNSDDNAPSEARPPSTDSSD